jgi:hypothetical protein
MKRRRDMLWTWLQPDAPGAVDEDAWLKHGGKWIVFDRKKRLLELAKKLEPFIESGEVQGAKYWNRDPGAICVYSLDRDREKVGEILDSLGAGGSRVWEYDYAWDKNIKSPLTFLYSQFSKLGTIIRSYGIAGTLGLISEVLRPGRRGG